NKWNAPIDALTVRDGIVSGAAGSSSYGDLIGNQQFNVQLKGVMTPFGLGPLIGSAKPKDPSQYRIVGTSVPRFDLAPKMTGEFTYMQDFRVPGMVHARVIHPAGIHSHLLGINGFDPEVPGARVVTKGDFVAVLADNEWDAIRGANALQV